MGATLDELIIQQSRFLGTTETVFYTTEKRSYAINRAIQEIMEQYDIPQYTVKTSLSFSGGYAALPTDCLRPAKLFEPNQYNIEYEELDFDMFSQQLSYSYFIFYDTGTDTEKIETYPHKTGTLSFWYIQEPPELTSLNNVRFKRYWDKAIAALSTQYLLEESRNTTQGEQMRLRAQKYVDSAWQTESARLQGKVMQRLQSIYETRSILGMGYNYFATSSLDMDNNTQWVEINSDASGQVNYGYIINNDSLVEVLLPLTANLGDVIGLVRKSGSLGNWRLTQNNGQKVILGDVETTQGTGGYLESTAEGDSVTLICTNINNEWTAVPGWVGNITYV